MAIKNLQILVIDKNPNPNLWTVDVKYTIIKLNLYFMVYSIVLKVEKIWLSGTLNIIRKPKKSLFSKRKRHITQER
jgi:predicted secreted protein